MNELTKGDDFPQQYTVRPYVTLCRVHGVNYGLHCHPTKRQLILKIKPLFNPYKGEYMYLTNTYFFLTWKKVMNFAI